MNHRTGRKVGGTFRADAKLLADVGLIHTFMTRLVNDLGMTALGYHMYDVPIAVKRLGQEVEHDEGGVSAVCVLSTSHAALHTWPEEGAATFDVHSCRDFDPDDVKSLISRMFETMDVDQHDLTYSLHATATHERALTPDEMIELSSN
jgi:S-adenosylmethionine/arginine decarboxylase-like enzyme